MTQQEPLRATALLYDEAVEQLRQKIWIRLLIFMLFTMVSARVVRYLDGVKSAPPLSIALQIVMVCIVSAGVWFRNTRYAALMHTCFLLFAHLITPVLTLMYGGVQGFSDLALFMCITISLVFGWRRWMGITLTMTTLTFIYVLYMEAIGKPLAPFVLNTPRFTSLKLLIFMGLAALIVMMGYQFYSQLVKKHQLFADEQLRLTAELLLSTQQLRDLSADLQQSRLNIVVTREEERRRLRHELQEQIGPALASLSYRTGAGRNMIKRQPQQAESELDTLENSIKATLDDVRRFAYALHPPMLDQLGLTSAIEQMVQGFRGLFSAEINTQNLPTNINAAIEITAFQLVQAVLNIVHKQLDDITITLRNESGHLKIEMQLIGRLNSRTIQAHAAMQTVLERIDEVGGLFAIQAVDNDTLNVVGIIPL